MTPNEFGLIGYPLSHSFSPAWFTQKFKNEGLNHYSYHLFPMETLAGLPELIHARPYLKGFNVTLPFKTKIIDFLNVTDELVHQTGASNTIRIERTGTDYRLSGTNTDVYGFRNSLTPLLTPQDQRALVLGYGGAARAVCFALTGLKIPFSIVSRNPHQADMLHWQEITPERFAGYPLIINCTPLGLKTADPLPPLPYHAAGTHQLFYDLIYNPTETPFLQEAKKHGARIKNGLEMLHLQAEEAWNFWNPHS